MKFALFRRNRMLFKKAGIGVLVAVLLFLLTGVALGSSDEHKAPKGWVATDTYRVMNFVVLVVALFILLRKPISQALDGRIQGIKDQLNELEEKKKNAERELAEYNKKISQLDSEAGKIVEEYIRQGKEAKARILEEAKLAAEKLEAQSARTIEHEFEQAKLKLQGEILEKALRQAEAAIRANITTNDQEKLVDEYLDKVVGH